MNEWKREERERGERRYKLVRGRGRGAAQCLRYHHHQQERSPPYFLPVWFSSCTMASPNKTKKSKKREREANKMQKLLNDKRAEEKRLKLFAQLYERKVPTLTSVSFHETH